MAKAAVETWTGTVAGSQLRVTLQQHRGRVWRVSMSELNANGEFFSHADNASTNIRRTRTALRDEGFVKE